MKTPKRQHQNRRRSGGPRPRRPQRRPFLARCPRCRRLTFHEHLELTGELWVGLTLPILWTDYGLHCYTCGRAWGFMHERDRTWSTLSTRIVPIEETPWAFVAETVRRMFIEENACDE